MPHETPEALRLPMAEHPVLSTYQKLGRVASVGLLLNPFAGLVNHGETQPVTPQQDIAVVSVEEQPATVLSEAPGVVITNESQHSSDNNQQQGSVQDAIDHATESHVDTGDSEQAQIHGDMLAEGTPYGVYGDNPGNKDAAPVAPHTAYGPVNNLHELRSITLPNQGPQAAE